MKVFLHLQQLLVRQFQLSLSKSCLLLFSILSSISLSAQQSKDSLEIITLLEKEGRTWRMGDKEEHAECWLERPYGRIMVSTVDGNTFNLPSKTMIDPQPGMMGNGGFAFHSDYSMKIGRDMAWVNHDEVSVDTNGKVSLSHEIRLLEKWNNQWKLVGQSIHSYNNPTKQKMDTTSYIQTVDIETGSIETVLTINEHFEAPNWHPDNYLIVNSKGKLYTLDLERRELELLETGFAGECNNDHGISPDNKWLAISHNDREHPSTKPYKSAIYVLPIGGGTPRKVTSKVPSYWHGWSPDGKRLAYCAERNGNYDIYTISVEGGEEKRLTNAEGLDDGPEYSPDGKYIYYNSYKSGHMQLWRMEPNGKNQEQLTFDQNSNWFPHPSPDGKWIVYIAYTSDQKQNHLFGKQVKLRLMNLKTRDIKDITPVFFGGQGTINVPSWSPDSKKVAFVSYSVN